MKNIIALLFILMLVFSLNTFAKDAFSFEPEEYTDSIIPPGHIGMEPFITGYRNSDTLDFSVVETAEMLHVHGTHVIQMTMTHPGTAWNIMAKNAVIGNQPENRDTSFLIGLNNRDTLWYWVYIPWSCPVDSIFIFVRNENWSHEEHTVYHPSDLNFGKWNELKDGISDNFSGQPYDLTNGNIIQSDFEVRTNPAISPPNCTLYIDAISSKGRVPPEYIDTNYQGGIKMPEPGEGVVKVSKGSINCIEYATNVTAPVMIQVFNVAGQKKIEIPIGMQVAGSYNIPLDLAAGVYIIRVVVGAEEETGKAICVK